MQVVSHDIKPIDDFCKFYDIEILHVPIARWQSEKELDNDR